MTTCQQRAVSLSVVNHAVSQPQINNNEHLFQLFRQSLRYKFLLLAITPSIHKRSLLSVHTSDSHTYTIKFSSDSHSYTSGHSYKLHSRSKPEAALLLSCRNHEGAKNKHVDLLRLSLIYIASWTCRALTCSPTSRAGIFILPQTVSGVDM